MKTDLFNYMHKEGKRKGHANNCVVIAIAIATGRDYEVAARACRLSAGRTKRRGLTTSDILNVFHENNIIIEDVYIKDIKVVKDLKNKDLTGKYFLISTGHASALVNNELHDYLDLSKSRKTVKRLIKVVSVPNEFGRI